MKSHAPQAASAEANSLRSPSQPPSSRETPEPGRASSRRPETRGPVFDFGKIPIYASPREGETPSTARRLADALTSAPLLPEAGGGGSALDATRRSEFEPRLGVDLSGVRLHTDPAANEASKALGARAFTRGGDIYFAAGRGPGDGPLLAHELAHVAQQAAGRAAPLEGLSGSEQQRSSLEAEADAFAAGRGAAVGAGASGPRVNASGGRVHVPVSAAPERAPLQLDAEGDLSAALRQRFAASDRAGIQRHRAQLRAICEAATPAEASALVSRLAENVPAQTRRRDELAELFYSTLHAAVRRELLAILARRAAAPSEPTTTAPPAAEPPTATVTHSWVLEPDSDSQQLNLHVPTVMDEPSYIDRQFLATVYSFVDGHSIYYGGAGGEPQAISVPEAAIDFGAASVENVGGTQIFESAEQALAAVSAAGGRGGGARPRVAYYHLNGSIVPTLFCPGTTPRVIAGWLEGHRRASETMGALAEALERLLIFRIIDTAGTAVGRMVIRLSETAPLAALEAMRRRLANSRAGRYILEEMTATPAPDTNRQWGAPTRGGEQTGAPPAGYGQPRPPAPTGTTTAEPHAPPAGTPRRPPSWHANSTTGGRNRTAPPRNSSEEAEVSPPTPTEEGETSAPPSQPETQMQLGAGGGGNAPARPRQRPGQQAAGGGGANRGPAPVSDMDRHPLSTPDCQVWGTPQAPQAERTMQFVRGAIASGRYSHIVINRSLGRAVGIGNAGTGTPDIVLISRSGNVHVVEIQSPGDSPAMYRAQLQRSLRFLSERGITSSGGRVFKLDGSTERYMYDPSIPEVENRLVPIADN